jgi:Coatomer gamma subunit appendage platform subdomain
LGRPFKTCEAMTLTDAATEHAAKAIVHFYESQVIVEFVCVNTLEDQLLDNVVIQLDTNARVSGARPLFLFRSFPTVSRSKPIPAWPERKTENTVWARWVVS